MLQGPVDQPDLEGLQIAGAGLAKTEMGQDFLEVTRPGLGPFPVLGEASWCDTELFGEMTDGGRGCGMELGRHEAQIAKGTDL
jgi:hypothetical protein